MGLEEMSDALGRERWLLELLLRRLEEQLLLMVSGRTAWLGTAARQVDYVVGEFKRLELLRAVFADDVAGGLGLTPGATLRELVHAAPPPWDTVLEAHRIELLALTDEIGEVIGSSASGTFSSDARPGMPPSVGATTRVAATIETSSGGPDYLATLYHVGTTLSVSLSDFLR